MTVRVWMRPSELGEQGYSVDFDASDWRRLKSGHLHLVRLEVDESDGEEKDIIVGRVEAGRFDAVLVLEEAEGD